MTEEKCVNDVRWMDGVDDIVDIQTTVVPEQE
jgi:hypothetical protein